MCDARRGVVKAGRAGRTGPAGPLTPEPLTPEPPAPLASPLTPPVSIRLVSERRRSPGLQSGLRSEHARGAHCHAGCQVGSGAALAWPSPARASQRTGCASGRFAQGALGWRTDPERRVDALPALDRDPAGVGHDEIPCDCQAEPRPARVGRASSVSRARRRSEGRSEEPRKEIEGRSCLRPSGSFPRRHSPDLRMVHPIPPDVQRGVDGAHRIPGVGRCSRISQGTRPNCS